VHDHVLSFTYASRVDFVSLRIPAIAWPGSSLSFVLMHHLPCASSSLVDFNVEVRHYYYFLRKTGKLSGLSAEQVAIPSL